MSENITHDPIQNKIQELVNLLGGRDNNSTGVTSGRLLGNYYTVTYSKQDNGLRDAYSLFRSLQDGGLVKGELSNDYRGRSDLRNLLANMKDVELGDNVAICDNISFGKDAAGNFNLSVKLDGTEDKIRNSLAECIKARLNSTAPSTLSIVDKLRISNRDKVSEYLIRKIEKFFPNSSVEVFCNYATSNKSSNFRVIITDDEISNRARYAPLLKSLRDIFDQPGRKDMISSAWSGKLDLTVAGKPDELFAIIKKKDPENILSDVGQAR